MQRASKKVIRSALPTKYEDLVHYQMLRPIHDGVDYDNAQEMIDRLTSIARRSAGQSEYLEALTILFADYEAKKHAIETADLSPLDVLKHLMDQHSMTASDLGRLLGDRALGPKILTGERELSKSHIRKLIEQFKIPADLFL